MLKKIIFIIVSILISASFYSCDGRIEGDDDYIFSTYIELKSDSQTYYSNKSLLETGITTIIGTNSSFDSNFPEIQTAKYRFLTSIQYINNDSAFKTTKTGIYRLVQKATDKTNNLDFSLVVLSKSDPTSSLNLVTFGTNNVNEIRLISKSSSECHYLISGTISATLKNSKTNVLLPISGKYSAYITTYL